MILKWTLKYVCFLALAFYGTMTLNLVSRILKNYLVKFDPYPKTTFSDKDLQRYDTHQIDSLKDLIVNHSPVEENASTTEKLYDTNVRSERNLQWTNNKKENNKNKATDEENFTDVGNISVFSAYYDARKGLEKPVVRIFGLTEAKAAVNLVCRFQESVNDNWILAEKSEMCENHGKLYGGYMFTCLIPEKMKGIPKKVFLQSLTRLSEQKGLNTTSAAAKDVKHIKLKLKHHKKKANTNLNNHNIKTADGMNNKTKYSNDLKIGVCVSPMYGKINLSHFIQFIELLKLQGVDHIIVYKMTVSKSVQILLDYYQANGDITVVNWTLPSFIQANQIWYHGQIIMIQDCLYRSMGNFDYLSFLDLDEAIIPRKDFHWSELIQRLSFISTRNQTNSFTAGFSFKSAYFDPIRADNQDENFQKLSFLRTFHRSKVLSSQRTKVIVKPEIIAEMGIHHISSVIDKTQNETVFDVPSDIGLIHHFKSCSIQLDLNMNCDHFVEDKSILKYEKSLTKQYTEVLRNNLKYLRTLT